MALERADKRIAHAASLAGYPVKESGLVVCEQPHLGSKYGPELSKTIDTLVQDYSVIFIDMLGAETMTRSFSERLAKKEHFLAMHKDRRLVLVDPNEAIVNAIWWGRRDNGLSPGMETIFTINPNPKRRIQA